MKSWIALLLAGCFCCSMSSAWNVVVEHAFGPGTKFSVRGSMELNVDESRGAEASAALSPAKLQVADAIQLKSLIDEDGLYLMRLAEDHFSGNEVVAAIPACHLRLGGFREDITLHVEWDGTIIGMDYKAPIGPLASTRDCKKMPVPESTQIITNVKVVRASSAQSVPLQVLTPNPPPGLAHLKENNGKQDQATAGSQSIIVKYWYIFLPLVITWMFSTSGPVEQGAPGAGAGANVAVGGGGQQGGR